MANRKSKSGGQSQGPKQAAGGGASQSPNPQATNKPRSVAAAHPKMMGNASSKPPASSGTAAAPRPPQPQPQANAPRLSNGTKRANGSNFVRGKHQGFGACVHELCRPTLVYTARVSKSLSPDEHLRHLLINSISIISRSNLWTQGIPRSICKSGYA